MIIGKILAYSDDTGNGVIISEDKDKYSFSVQDWNSFENTPIVGMRVYFIGADDGRALEIEVASDVETYDKDIEQKPKVMPKDLQKTEQKPTNSEEAEEKIVDLNDEKELLIDEEPLQKVKSQKNENFRSDLGMQGCINSFFMTYEEAITEDTHLRLESKELDYLKMKRFLYTAYNNLLEIDTGFENYILADIKSSLDKYYELYKKFKVQTKYMKTTFERVFLDKQEAYKKLRVEIEINKKELANLKNIVETNEAEFKKDKKILNTLNEKSPEYAALYKKLKQYKKRLVDGIHEATTIRELNRELVEKAEKFYNINYTPFVQMFNKKQKEFEENIIKILNVLAYKLDSVIWQNANESENVKNFFKSAGITTKFSSATYLRYYINSLDMSKLNEENHELLELLHYLEKKEQSIVAIFGDDIENVKKIENLVLQVKGNAKTVIATRESILMRDLKKDAPTTLLINPLARGCNIEKVLANLKYLYPQLDVGFIADSLTKDVLLLAKKFKVSMIIQPSDTENNQKNRIEVLLDN